MDVAVERVTVITRKGQITLPAPIRRALGLREGDRVAVALEEGNAGQARLRPVRSVAEETYGAVSGKRGLDPKALRRAFEDGQGQVAAQQGRRDRPPHA